MHLSLKSLGTFIYIFFPSWLYTKGQTKYEAPE